MLQLRVLPAGKGDCIWLEYGDAGDPRRVLIDGGVRATYSEQLKPRLLAEAERTGNSVRFEALVLTHIDGDHIQGLLELIDDPEAPVEIADVWFNGWHHLPGDLSPAEAFEFTDALWNRQLPWNEAFSREAVVVDDEVDLPRVTLPGGLELTLLSPGTDELRRLRRVFDTALGDAGLIETWRARYLAPGDEGDPTDSMNIERLADSTFKKDTSVANGSSIAFMAAWDGRRILLGGDAHASVLETSLRRLCSERGERRVRVDAFKVSHHGSAKNLDKRLLGLIDCRDYIFSTDGTSHGHPDTKAIARILVHGRPSSGEEIRLHFNYLSPGNEKWDDIELKREHGYGTRYPSGVDRGLVIDVA